MENEYDYIQRNPSRVLLVAGSDSEELRDDFRSENSRDSNCIRHIYEGLGSDSGTTSRRYFSPTWRMERVTETLNKQQERDDCHIIRTIPLRISLQRAANQSYPHQIRQNYISIRFNITENKKNVGSGSEENSQATLTTENTNTDSTYSMNNSNTELVRNRVKQTRGQIRGNRRGRRRGRCGVIKGVFENLEEDIFQILPPIPKIRKVLIGLEKFKLKSIMKAPWWPGQIWFTNLLTDSSRYLILGESSLILNLVKEITKRKYMLSPEKIATFTEDQESNKEENY
ncbi:MAG: hypothetical protein EZS28_008621 [Streblomastix strix]|uniref:Uncharacterized protein n=1 Tax=Streblomastix strix TaxID=222440 RepID=A0A5J4WLL5_9EUKA|nr:MAG: hypothetical protein EZS28_008621 [Streblomastix strix]